MNSIAPDFKISILNTSFVKVAEFDIFESGTYTKSLNNVGSYNFSISADDSRCDLLLLDSIVIIYRKISGLSSKWNVEFVGLHRVPDYDMMSSGSYRFSSSGVCINDFLSRTSINYPAATVKSYKWDLSEKVMKEYVEENCGYKATILEGREYDGVLSSFSVSDVEGYGKIWEGDKSYQNLIKVLQDISAYSAIDFAVILNDDLSGFTFKTFEGILGADRTSIGIDRSTGKNSAGNYPVVFSAKNGNIKTMKYTFDRISESNVVTVLGNGDGADRVSLVRSSSAVNDSIWNRREISRPISGFLNDMEVGGDSFLKENSGKERITFSPLMQKSCMYGIHYFLGDRITIEHKGLPFHRKISKVTNSINESENISFELTEIN